MGRLQMPETLFWFCFGDLRCQVHIKLRIARLWLYLLTGWQRTRQQRIMFEKSMFKRIYSIALLVSLVVVIQPIAAVVVAQNATPQQAPQASRNG